LIARVLASLHIREAYIVALHYVGGQYTEDIGVQVVVVPCLLGIVLGIVDSGICN